MAADLRPYRTRLIGVPSEVATVLRAAAARGHLVEMGEAEPLADHRVAVDVVLLREVDQTSPPAPAVFVRPAESPARPWYLRPLTWVRVAGGIAVLGVLGGLTWLVYTAVVWVADHWVLVVGALAVLLVLAGLVASRVTSSGDHCPGCRG